MTQTRSGKRWVIGAITAVLLAFALILTLSPGTAHAASPTHQVTGSVVNVRATPGGAIVGQVRKGAKVTATTTVKAGFRKLVNGRWISAQYLTKIPAKKTTTKSSTSSSGEWSSCPKVTLGGVKFGKGKITKSMGQVVTVNGSGGSHAKVTLWTRVAGKKCEFKATKSENGRVGYGGIVADAKRRQGTGTTPAGIYTMTSGFSNGSKPKTKLAWRVTKKNHYWVQDNKSTLYNTYATSGKGFRTSEAEHLRSYGSQYRYSIVIDFNTAKTRGKGAGIFLHVNGRGATAGCVSVSKPFMKQIANQVAPGDLIAIVK